MYYNSPACQNYTSANGSRFCGSAQIEESSADEQEFHDKKTRIGPIITLHNCLNQLEKCTVQNCALNIFDNVVVKEELIIDDYEDSESVIENYYYDSFEKWSEFGQPLKTFLQNSNFNYHVEENYLDGKLLEDAISNNSSYDDSLNSLAGGSDKTIVIRNQEWALEKVFKSEELVKSYLDEHNWSLRVRYNTQFGKKSLYRCNLVKNKMPQCAAKVSMEYNKKSKSFLVYNNRQKHTHGTILLRQSSSDRNVRQKVRELVDLGLSKYEIQLHLENNGYNLPNDTLVNKPESEPIAARHIVETKPKMEIDNKIDNSTTATKWYLERKFANSEFALQYMKQTGIWGICSKKRGRLTDKQYYRCNRVRKVGPQCAAQKYLLIDHVSGGATLFGINEHTHDMILAMNSDEIGGIKRMDNVHIKKEPKSDSENDPTYKYCGYDDERKVGSSRTFKKANEWKNFNSTKDVNTENDNSSDRLSSLSSDENKSNEHFWILNRTFKTGALAKLYLGDHKIWKLNHRELNGIGLKCNYRCGLVEETAVPQCAAMAYAQYHVKNDKVFFYTNSLDHTHGTTIKTDSDKKVNKVFRDHPKNNSLNSHINPDLDSNESETDIKTETSQDRHSLRQIKSEVLTSPASMGTKSPKTETVEYISFKNKKRVLPWKLEKSFPKLKNALIYMKNKQNWYMWKKQNFRHGGSSKSYYRCTVRYDGKHCPAQKHLFVDKSSNKISIYRCHDHIHEPTSPIPGSPIPFDSAVSEIATSTENSPIKNEDTGKEITTDNKPSNTDAKQLSCSTNGTWGNNWELEMKFSNMIEAIQYMKSKEIWSICGKLKVLSGYRQYYRCNLVKKSGPQCDARKYLFFNTPTADVLLYGCNSHTHDLILSQRLKSELEIDENGGERRRRTTLLEPEEKRYVLDRKFKNLELAISYIKDANTWTHHSSLKSMTGVRRYYLCRLRGNRKSSLKCEARCCLSIKNGKQEVCLYNRSSSHTHPVPYKPTKRNEIMKKTYKAANTLKKPDQDPESIKQLQMSGSLRQYHSWELERNFINSEYALKYMKREKIWSIFSKRRTNNGNEIQYYRCNEVKKTGPQCAAQKYLVFHSNRAKVSLYGRNEHTHDAILAEKNIARSDNDCQEEIVNIEGQEDASSSYIVENIEPEATIDETDDEPLNENLYAVDVVIEEDEPSIPTPVSKPVRGRGLGRNYVFEKKFRNCKTAISYIKSQAIWSVTFTGRTANGYRQRFRCNLVSRKGPQCAARKYLVYDTSKGVQIYSSIMGHTHESILGSLPDDESYSNQYDNLDEGTPEKVEVQEEIPAEQVQPSEINKRPRQGWKRKLYNLERKFKNAQSALNYMKTQKQWGLHSKTKRKHDRKQYYRCNYVKVGGPQCQAGKFLLYSELKKEVSLFYCNNHTHDAILKSLAVKDDGNTTDSTSDENEQEESETTKNTGESFVE